MRLTGRKNAWLGGPILVAVLAVVLAGCGGGAASHAATTATLAGQVELCGGPTAAPCRLLTGRISGCEGSACNTLSEIGLFTLGGRLLGTTPLSRGRFTFNAQPGGYIIELLRVPTGSGSRHAQGQAAQIIRIQARAGKTTKVVFKLDAG